MTSPKSPPVERPRPIVVDGPELEDDVGGRRRLVTILMVILSLGILAGGGWWFFLRDSTGEAIPAPTTPTPGPTFMPPPPPPAAEVPEPEEVEPPRTESVPSTTTRPRTSEKPTPVAEKPAPPAPVEPDPADFRKEPLFVTSRPSGARVKLDGKTLGKTPLEVMVAGKGRLNLELDGYKKVDREIRLADVRGSVNFDLEAESEQAASAGPVGKIFLSSAPAGAEILLEGRVLGTTPKMIELPVGNRTLQLRSGALKTTVDLEIKEGKNPARHVPL